MKPGDRPAVLRIISTYIIFSAVWIFLSDRLLEVIFRTSRAISIAQTYKGWLFVLISAGLIALLLFREQNVRLRRESVLLTSQHSFTSLLDGSSTPMWIYDLYSRELLVANDAALKQYGFSVHEFLNLKIDDLLLGEDGQLPVIPHENISTEAQAMVAQSHGEWRGELQRTEHRQLRKKDGTLISSGDHHLPDRVCRPRISLVSAEDITQREAKQAAIQAAEEQRLRDQTALIDIEEALLQSDARLHAAVESFPFDFWMMDTQGHYVMQNAACLEHWGNLIGRMNKDLDLPAGLLEAWERQNQPALNGKSNGMERSYSRPDGETVYEYSIVAPVMDRGAPFGILGVNVDISDLKQRERDLLLMITVANALRTLSTRKEIELVLLEQVINQIGIWAAALVHFESEQSEVVFDLGGGDWANLTGIHIPADTVATQVLQHGHPYQTDYLPGERGSDHVLVRKGLNSAICVPLVAYEQILAGLWVGSQKPFGDVRFAFANSSCGYCCQLDPSRHPFRAEGAAPAASHCFTLD